MKKIILTGGGTAGHVTPNIALLPSLEQAGYDIVYIGSHKGMEKELIESCNIKYYGISSGKLRRYIDFENIKDAFKVVKGIFDALKLIKKLKPNIIFSKGGFVSVPVVIAGKFCNVPIIIHESDISPGLANKICIPFSNYVCAAFPEALESIPKQKAVLTGTPIRKQLFDGNKKKGLQFCNLNEKKPIILVIGGSSGSIKINECLIKSLPSLLENYQIIHICGKGNKDDTIKADGYKQYEYISSELPNIFACADIIVSRAGANSISEFLALKKPSLLIPLSAKASRGDQILNAKSFEKQGFSKVLYEENLTTETFISEINNLYNNRNIYIEKMSKCAIKDGVLQVMEIIKKY